jgi:hypothetical protein
LQEKIDAVKDHIQFLESVLELEDLVEQEPGVGMEGGAGGVVQHYTYMSTQWKMK